MVEVTQEDVQRKMRYQQRFLAEGISESELLDEEFARYRTQSTATLQAENDALKARVKVLEGLSDGLRRYIYDRTPERREKVVREYLESHNDYIASLTPTGDA